MSIDIDIGPSDPDNNVVHDVDTVGSAADQPSLDGLTTVTSSNLSHYQTNIVVFHTPNVLSPPSPSHE